MGNPWFGFPGLICATNWPVEQSYTLHTLPWLGLFLLKKCKLKSAAWQNCKKLIFLNSIIKSWLNYQLLNDNNTFPASLPQMSLVAALLIRGAILHTDFPWEYFVGLGEEVLPIRMQRYRREGHLLHSQPEREVGGPVMGRSLSLSFSPVPQAGPSVSLPELRQEVKDWMRL